MHGKSRGEELNRESIVSWTENSSSSVRVNRNFWSAKPNVLQSIFHENTAWGTRAVNRKIGRRRREERRGEWWMRRERERDGWEAEWETKFKEKMDNKDLRNNKKIEGIDKMNEGNVKQKRLALRNGVGKRGAGIESSVDGSILRLEKNFIYFSWFICKRAQRAETRIYRRTSKTQCHSPHFATFRWEMHEWRTAKTNFLIKY